MDIEKTDWTSANKIKIVGEKIGELFGALSKAQGEFTDVKKDKEVTIQTKTGGSFKFKYASSAEIRNATQAALTKNSLAVTQIVEEKETGEFLTTIVGHSCGSALISSMMINTRIADPKSVGALITYYRRYQKSAILDIVSDDDDDETPINNFKGAAIRPQQKQNFNDKSPITKKQLGFLSEQMKRRDWDRNQVLQLCKELNNVEDLTKLNMGQFSKMMDIVLNKTFEQWEQGKGAPDFDSNIEIPWE